MDELPQLRFDTGRDKEAFMNGDMPENTNTLPSWTSYTKPPDIKGRDFLGVQNVGNRMMDALLPGLTGATRHPRYYSFLCWAIWKTSDWGGAKTDSEKQVALYKLENIFLYAAYLHSRGDCSTGGLVGSESIARLLSVKALRYPLSGFDPERGVSAFNEANYRPSINELELVARKNEMAVPSETRGMPLAREFENSVAPVLDLLKNIFKRNSITRNEAERLGPYLCLCRMDKFPKERKLIAQIILGEHPTVVDGDLQRRKSLLFILDALGYQKESVYPDYDIPLTAYNLRGKKKDYKAPAQLEATVMGWAIFQHRAYLQYAIAGLWAAFLKELEQTPGEEQPIGRIVGIWAKAASTAGLAGKTVKRLKKQDIATVTLSELLSAMAFPKDVFSTTATISSLKELRKTHDALRMGPESELDEDLIYNALYNENYAENRPYTLAYLSVILLITALAKWSRFVPEGTPLAEPLTQGGQHRLSCMSLREDLVARLYMTVPEFLNFCIRKYVVDQHYIFATEKLWGERDTFHFYQSENGILLRSAKDGKWSSTNYIPSSLQLMHGLGLVEVDSGQSYQASPNGKKLLEAAFGK